MKYSVRNVGGVAVIGLSGCISPGRTIADRLALQEIAAEQLTAGYRKLVLNLAEVKFVDSSGLSDLIGAIRLVQGQGGQLHLCNANRRIADLLYRTRLDSIILCFADEAAALHAFSSNGHTTTSAA